MIRAVTDSNARPRLWVLLALSALVVVLLALVWRSSPVDAPAPAPASGFRVVSLSPALTETLFAIGAGDQVAGVSDYCDYPRAARERPRAGTSITPRYEAIVKLAPSLIVTEDAVNTRPEELERLAPTMALPWLSLDDVVAGTRELGHLTGHAEQAKQLARQLRQALDVAPPKGAPRVLLVLGYGASKLDEVWFIRRNSLHGAALRAAGARNAVAKDVVGQPRLSLEQLLVLDPDAVIVLLNDSSVSERAVEREWGKLSVLRAVQQGKVAVLQAPEAFSNGPRILQLVDRLKKSLRSLFAQ